MKATSSAIVGTLRAIDAWLTLEIAGKAAFRPDGVLSRIETKSLLDLCGEVLGEIDAEMKAARPKQKPKKPGGRHGTGAHAGCGTGAGGFKPGNTCATGSGAGPGPDKKPPSAKEKRAFEDDQERAVAAALGGKRLRGYETYDVEVPKPAGRGKHVVEVKSMHSGGKTALSVHPGAHADKAAYAEANPSDTFHTIALDRRSSAFGGRAAENYSGHDVYYKRACGPYSLSKMYKCKDMAEAKRLMGMPAEKLPEAARGEFPTGEALLALKKKGEQDRAYNNERSKARKERLGAAAYGRASGAA